MPESIFVALSIATGTLVGLSVLHVGLGGGHLDAAQWLARRRRAQNAQIVASAPLWAKAPGGAQARLWLVDALDRAGWDERPERVAVVALAAPLSLGILGASTVTVLHLPTAAILSTLGACVGFGSLAVSLTSAIRRRRRRLAGELIPILELFSIELSAGGSPISALGSVAMQVEGELARDVRRLLIASQVAGSQSFESRLFVYAERLDLPPLASLSTILAASREYGTGVVQGVRALATDMRRAQRRELIAHSRRALNHVLFPAAVGVLMPFLAVLLFPAVTTLMRSFR